MLTVNHFYDESAPDLSCQRLQPDPDAIFAHDSRKHLSFPLLLHPIKYFYLFHASPYAPPLKMPAGELLFDRPIRPPPTAPRIHRPAPVAPELAPFPSHLRLLALCQDVLRIIVEFCPIADSLQLALTCKQAYAIAMPRIVSDVSLGDPGDDDGPDRLAKFCRFMLSKPDLCAKSLHALRLLDGAFARPSSAGARDGWGADFSPAALLVDVLLKANALHTLHIRDAEPLFQSHPAVYDAVSQLPNLKELSLYYIGNSCLKAISELQGKLHVIENGLWKDGPRPQGDVTPFGLYVDHLEHIKLWECGCMLESVIDRHIWPHVHTLDIGGRIAKISQLAHAFPNLRRLTFYLEFSVKQETGSVVCWPELDYLETSAPIPLFPSPVRRLQLQYPIGARSRSQNDLKTLPLMEKTNPVVLSLTISHTVSDTTLERMKASMPSLRYMELVLNDGAVGRASMQWKTFQDWVERNLDIMRQTSLVGLRISYAGLGSTSLMSEQQRRRITHMARLLAETIETLEYVGVGYHDGEAGMYASDCMWFRVPRPADGTSNQSLALLSNVDGERVRAILLDTPRVE